MTNAEAFLIQWSTLKEEMMQTIHFQINQGGTIRFSDLNKTFQTKTKRWSTRMSEEGRWMEAVENKECKRDVLNTLSTLSLQELQVERQGGSTALLAGLGGAVAGGVIGGAIEDAIGGMISLHIPAGIVGVAGAVGGTAVAYGIVKGRSTQKNKEHLEEVVQLYLAQIDSAGKMVAEVWRRYESDNC